ncbi:hypothetical protein B0O99DRAFT_591737 [Bisporella sp. PMI_857]|nr:hypothetical protein B0O99DRAFT_591737 [Bisporella sp. PMI_857]
MVALFSRVLKFGRTSAATGELGIPIAKPPSCVKKAIYRRLGSHPHILKFDGLVLIKDDIYSLKLERALGDLRRLILECAAPTQQTRLQMSAWKAPFPDLTEQQVRERCANEQFPETGWLLLGNIIRNCWDEKFGTVADVEKSLREKLVDFGGRTVTSFSRSPVLAEYQTTALWPYGEASSRKYLHLS